MLHLFCGEDTQKSRQMWLQEREKSSAKDYLSFSKSTFNMESFQEALRARPLFDSSPTIIIDGLPDLRVNRRLPELISSAVSQVDIFLWVDKDLPAKSQLVKIAKENGSYLSFKSQDNELAFVWLELLFSRNKEKSLKLLQQLLDEGASPVYLVALISSQVRSLLALVTETPYIFKKHPFYLRKLKAIKKDYSREFLENSLLALAEHDYKIKTGQLLAENAIWQICYSFINICSGNPKATLNR